jgi:hypothetical protein
MRSEPTSPLRERVIVLAHEGHSAEILEVVDIDHARILAGPDHQRRSIPIADVREYIAPEGRVWVLHAPDWYVQETKHLASVEMSRVIQAAVNYQRPGAASPKKNRWAILLPILLIIFVLIFVMAVLHS